MCREEFTCSICGKSCGNSKFEHLQSPGDLCQYTPTDHEFQEKSQIRHISYCQKSKSRVRSRKKSCLICTKAKTRCDLTYPSCSRCTKKNLTCGYDQPRLPTTPVVQVSETPVVQSTETALVTPQTLAEPIAEPPPNLATTLDLARVFAIDEHTDPLHPPQSPVHDPAEFISSDPSTWNFENTDLIFPYLESVPAQTVSQYPRSSSPVMGFVPRLSMDYPSSEIMDAILYKPVVAKAPKAFRPRTVRDHQFSLGRRYLLCTLRSYPHMILPGKPLPPFIHPHFLTEVSGDGGVTHTSLPRPLANCTAIMQMCSAKNESNVTFIWRAIRMEQERLSAEVRLLRLSSRELLETCRSNSWQCLGYDDVNAVAALQAITIYVLLRLSEGNDEATDFDIPLIYTMMVHKTGGYSPQEFTRTESIQPRSLPFKQVNRLSDMEHFPRAASPHGKIGSWASH